VQQSHVTETDLRVDPLTGAHVVVTPWRQNRPNRPDGLCPFCPGGLEAPEPYDVLHIPNRWPGLANGCHEVVLHGPEHDSSFPILGKCKSAQVVELWSARSAALGSREDVTYVFVFENRGRQIGTTIDHPHSQIMAFGEIPPIPKSELSKSYCDLCKESDDGLVVTRNSGWRASVPWAPSWPYEMLLYPDSHVADLPAAGPQLRAGLGAILVDTLTRMERLFGRGTPYMLWIHQRPTSGEDWPAAHVHVHLAPVLRAPGVIRHLAAAELGAGVFFDPVDPYEAATQLRSALDGVGITSDA
jgi:UDPglucose--hexose-1-phosphate uridylyltransferase